MFSPITLKKKPTLYMININFPTIKCPKYFQFHIFRFSYSSELQNDITIFNIVLLIKNVLICLLTCQNDDTCKSNTPNSLTQSVCVVGSIGVSRNKEDQIC